jgi:hypothetical protein
MHMSDKRVCPDCETESSGVDRRQFLKVGATAVAISAMPVWIGSAAHAADKPKGEPETLVKTLFETLSDDQKSKMCYDWDHVDPKMGLLRTRVANNWHINSVEIKGDFYTKPQKELIRAIFEGCYNPEWISKIDKQLDDDAGGYGNDQNVAIFGKPGSGKFEFVMTGRHLTLRCDGNSTENMAFGGPIFYGHAASGFNEEATHPGNVFCHQAVEANKVFEMLSGKQREQALITKLPKEQDSGFRGPSGQLPGIALTEMSADQKAQVQKTLQKLIEPYRQTDKDEVLSCLKSQGGLDKCSLAFYSDQDIGNDKVWDCWRLEGPSFVWYFRGSPHVHVWVNVGSDPSIKLNA